MTLSPEIRAAVRKAFQRRCGYCGVSEVWVGSELQKRIREMETEIAELRAVIARLTEQA